MDAHLRIFVPYIFILVQDGEDFMASSDESLPEDVFAEVEDGDDGALAEFGEVVLVGSPGLLDEAMSTQAFEQA